MLIYLYDGTWDGLMTAVYEAYARHERPDRIIQAGNLAMNWLDQYSEILTDTAKAAKVSRSIPIKISSEAAEHVDLVFRTSDSDKATRIYDYIRLGYELGRTIDNHLQTDSVRQIHEISRRVSFEVHRFKGLLRFVKTDWGAYYAQFSPDSLITDLLAPHFADRLSDQRWIIHDTSRQIAALYNGQSWVMTDNLPDALTTQQDSEQQYQALWRMYFLEIAIPERKNSRLQRQFMPARYWQNLTELQGTDVLLSDHRIILQANLATDLKPTRDVSDDLLLQPFAAAQTLGEQDRPDQPVSRHGDPNAKQPHIEVECQSCTHSDTQNPHAAHGDKQLIPHIACTTEPCR